MGERYRVKEKSEKTFPSAKEREEVWRREHRERQQEREKKQDRRLFFTAFFSTVCLCLLGIGILEADYQSRKIGFGDEKTLLYAWTGREGDLLEQIAALDFFQNLCYTYRQ